jgi:hypothetical protein
VQGDKSCYHEEHLREENGHLREVITMLRHHLMVSQSYMLSWVCSGWRFHLELGSFGYPETLILNRV